MRRAALSFLAALLALALVAPGAQAAFGLKDLDVTFADKNGSTEFLAGAHPFAMTTSLAFNTEFDADLGYEVPVGSTRDLSIAQIPGFIGNQTAVPRCTSVDFVEEECPVATQVGFSDVVVKDPGTLEHAPLYNLVPPPGVVAKLGFNAVQVPVVVNVVLNPDPPYNLIASLANVPAAVPVFSSKVTLWGNPADKAHDPERVGCGLGGCSVNIANVPFLTLPRACLGPLPTIFKASSWETPNVFDEPPPVLTHDNATPPQPLGFEGCSQLPFDPTISASPTSKATGSPTGLDFRVPFSSAASTAPAARSASIIVLQLGRTADRLALIYYAWRTA